MALEPYSRGGNKFLDDPCYSYLDLCMDHLYFTIQAREKSSAAMYNRDWHFGFETSRFRNFCPIFEGFGFGFGKFGFGKKVSVSVSKKFGLGKKSRSRFRKIWSRKRKNPNNKNSARNDVPNLGLGPNWDQSPEMVPYKSQFCSQVPNFILVARCQAKSNISLINSTVNNNKKHVIFNLIVFVIVCFLSQRKCPYLNAFAECLLLNNVI